VSAATVLATATRRLSAVSYNRVRNAVAASLCEASGCLTRASPTRNDKKCA
jgi:hypothetical protein